MRTGGAAIEIEIVEVEVGTRALARRAGKVGTEIEIGMEMGEGRRGIHGMSPLLALRGLYYTLSVASADAFTFSCSGVPVIQSSTTQSDGITTAEVLAKARAEVEAENMKDEEASTSRKHPKDDDGDEKGTETGEKEAKKVDARTEAPTFGAEEASKKRTRDDDDGAVDGEREAKKVYTRTELDGAAEAS